MNLDEATRSYSHNPEFAQQVNERFQALLTRSATDMAFRNQLLTEPRAALAAFAGKDVSALGDVPNIVFIENKANATIVLPDPIDPEAELSAEELEAVAGGATPCILSCIVSVLWIADAIGGIMD
jgi:lactobin A/cerein 7B family class IIb bacteriocin